MVHEMKPDSPELTGLDGRLQVSTRGVAGGRRRRPISSQPSHPLTLATPTTPEP